MLQRILLIYAMETQSGYGQGMNDICSIVLDITDDEAEAFWLVREILELNRDIYGDGFVDPERVALIGEVLRVTDAPLWETLHAAQTGFAFSISWLLLLFKRNLPRDQVFLLWDVCFLIERRKAHPQAFFAQPEDRLFLFYAAAVVQQFEAAISAMSSDEELMVFFTAQEDVCSLELLLQADYLCKAFDALADASAKQRLSLY